jgi:Fic-DOC domain mobile mystery protein B
MNFEYASGATPIDPYEAEGLIPTHLTTQKELNAWEQANIIDAIKTFSANSFSSSEILNLPFLLKLHKKMFDETWKWAGTIRKTEKNIGTAPEKIREEIIIFLDDVNYWIKNKTYLPDEICVRFHVRLVQIHLFPNGNGRHGRLATDLLTEALSIESFTWGSKDLYNKNEARTEYISGLKEADKNNFKPLLDFIRK